MSLYLGHTLVAGRAPRVIFCQNMREYRYQLMQRGASGLGDFYYVPADAVQDGPDLDGLRISILPQPAPEPPESSDDQEPPQPELLSSYVVYYGKGDNSDLWRGLEYTTDGIQWKAFSESAAKADGGVSVLLTLPKGEETGQNSAVWLRSTIAGNKAMYSQTGAFWRRIRLEGEPVQIDGGDFLYLINSAYATRQEFTYQGCPCVFASAFAGSGALAEVGVQLPTPDFGSTYQLSATPSCYIGMFSGCKRLSSVSDIRDFSLQDADGKPVFGNDAFAGLYAGCAGLSSVGVGFMSVELSAAFGGWLDGAGPAAQGVSGEIYVNDGRLSGVNDYEQPFRPGNWKVVVNEDDGDGGDGEG